MNIKSAEGTGGVAGGTLMRLGARWELSYVGLSNTEDQGGGVDDHGTFPIELARSHDGIRWSKVGDQPIVDSIESRRPLMSSHIVDGRYTIFIDHGFGDGGLAMIQSDEPAEPGGA